MAILGTKKFWKPAPGATSTQKENQILKNAGYINIQLHSVNYMSVGNFWQNTFGGSDNIALATSLKYQSGTESIEATSVQDVREVEANKIINFGLQRNIAVKIPANADALSLEVKMTAVKDDSLQTKFDMLNKSEYQAALQLAPTVVGQVLTITSLVKKLFTDSDPHSQLDAGYAGIISLQPEDNPVSSGKLTKGMLILISANDGDRFINADDSKFSFKGDSLYYDNRPVENTYIVFNISFEQFKGDDEKSNWFKKYVESLNNLDKMELTFDKSEHNRIYNDSKTLWIEGNALLDADMTYINSEKAKIKAASIRSINDKYRELSQLFVSAPEAGSKSAPVYKRIPSGMSADIIRGLTGSESLETLTAALPATGNYLNENLKIDKSRKLESSLISDLEIHQEELSDLLEKDTLEYLNTLSKNKIKWNLGKTDNQEYIKFQLNPHSRN